jgi:hypothetical protein
MTPTVVTELLNGRPREYRRTCPQREWGRRDDALAIRTPDQHRHCRRCWSWSLYRLAVTGFLAATRGEAVSSTPNVPRPRCWRDKGRRVFIVHHVEYVETMARVA